MPVALYLAAVAALAIALAQPSMVVAVPREEATVILTMDTSRSMLADRRRPGPHDRGQGSRRSTSSTSSRPGSRWASWPSRPRRGSCSPPTTDRTQLHDAINGLRADGGTALGDAIDLSLQAAGLGTATPASPAAERASPDPSASPDASTSPSASPEASAGTDDQGTPLVATVLLSDGKSSTGEMDPLDAADEAAERRRPGLHDRPRHGRRHRRRPRPARPCASTIAVPPDPDTLGEIAERTGARFFEAPTAEDLQAIYEGIGSKVGFTNEEQEVTQWFAAGALVLVLAGAGFAALWFNRIP